MGKRTGGGEPLKMFIQPPWFEHVANGSKSVEGRAAHEGRWRQHTGKTIHISRPGSQEVVKARITDVRHYSNLEEYLDAEWEAAAPHCPTKEKAREAYLDIYMKVNVQVFGEERVRERGGMEAIELQLID